MIAKALTIMAALVLLAGCATTSERGFNTGRPGLKTIPQHLRGELSLVDQDTNEPLDAIATQIFGFYQQSRYEPSRSALSDETKKFLDRKISQIKRGEQKYFTRILVKTPQSRLPDGHLAFQIQSYLKTNGFHVPVETLLAKEEKILIGTE